MLHNECCVGYWKAETSMGGSAFRVPGDFREGDWTGWWWNVAVGGCRVLRLLVEDVCTDFDAALDDIQGCCHLKGLLK